MSAAGKRVIDHFRSDGVVRAGNEAAVRIIREVKPEMDEQDVSQAAARFHVVAQGAGVAATAGDIALTVAFAGWSGLFLKDIGMKPFQPPAGSKAEAVLGGSSHSPLKNNLPPGLAFGGAAAGIAVFRPARAFSLFGERYRLGRRENGPYHLPHHAWNLASISHLSSLLIPPNLSRSPNLP